jgi:hypothetical protein
MIDTLNVVINTMPDTLKIILNTAGKQSNWGQLLVKIPTIIGLSFIGSGFIWLIIEVLIWRWINLKSNDKLCLKEMTLLAYFNGVIEISMFSFSLIIGAPQLIFLWIGVKTALRWDRKKKTNNFDNYMQRGSYFSFLIGSALSIVFSYFIASFICQELIIFK